MTAKLEKDENGQSGKCLCKFSHFYKQIFDAFEDKRTLKTLAS